MLEKGADRSILPSLSDDILKNDLGIVNTIHRIKLLQALEGTGDVLTFCHFITFVTHFSNYFLECKHIDDMEIAILSKHIDIFISYRRSTGNQLASLIKVLLQLRGYKVKR